MDSPFNLSESEFADSPPLDSPFNFSESEFADSPPPEKFMLDEDEEMTEEEMQIYYNAIKQHGRFGVMPDLPPKEGAPFGMITTYNLPYTSRIKSCAGEAIKHYNTQNDTNYELVTIVRVNQSASIGILYYLTLEAKQIGTAEESPITTFEAQVLAGINDYIGVDFCRQKVHN